MIFKALSDRMRQLPDLRVRMFLNAPRPYRDSTPEAELLKRFADRFRLDAVVHEFVTQGLTRLATVIGALNQLAEPTAVLRRIEPIQVCERSLEMVDLPASKVGASDIPPFALCIGSQNECSLARPNQYSYTTHLSLFSDLRLLSQQFLRKRSNTPAAQIHQSSGA